MSIEKEDEKINNQPHPNLKKIKILRGVVVVLTALIIFGLGALIYGIANKKITEAEKESKQTIAEPKKEKLSLKKKDLLKKVIQLEELKGAQIKSYEVKGELIFIHVIGGLKSDRILIVNYVTGEKKTEILLYEKM